MNPLQLLRLDCRARGCHPLLLLDLTLILMLQLSQVRQMCRRPALRGRARSYAHATPGELDPDGLTEGREPIGRHAEGRAAGRRRVAKGGSGRGWARLVGREGVVALAGRLGARWGWPQHRGR
eukprot:scaffold144969_cov28-Tisochrysis_lutea.AAC.3